MSGFSPVGGRDAGPEPRDAPGRDAPGRVDLAWRVVGGLVAVAGALITAVIEVFLAPLRVGTVRLPVSLLLAVVGNLALVWFTYQATGRRGVVALPALVWMVVMVRAAGRTTEGDLLLTGGNWAGLLTILGGTAAFAAGAYRLILPGRRDQSRRG